jgi:hypothetical protein
MISPRIRLDEWKYDLPPLDSRVELPWDIRSAKYQDTRIVIPDTVDLISVCLTISER